MHSSKAYLSSSRQKLDRVPVVHYSSCEFQYDYTLEVAYCLSMKNASCLLNLTLIKNQQRKIDRFPFLLLQNFSHLIDSYSFSALSQKILYKNKLKVEHVGHLQLRLRKEDLVPSCHSRTDSTVMLYQNHCSIKL